MSIPSRTVGVIGGMGPAATVDFLGRLVRHTSASCDQDHLRVLVDSNPGIPDRTAYILGRGTDPTDALIATAVGLEKAGADLLVMPCNTAYSFADEIRARIRVDLIDWPDEVGRALSMRGVRCAGLLATRGTLAARIYQRALGRHHVEAVLPDADAQVDVMAAIGGPAGVKSAGVHSVDARSHLERAAKSFIDLVDVVLLACTELSAMDAARPISIGVPTIDAADIVARRVVSVARGQ
jgi:aspartate racemase